MELDPQREGYGSGLERWKEKMRGENPDSRDSENLLYYILKRIKRKL